MDSDSIKVTLACAREIRVEKRKTGKKAISVIVGRNAGALEWGGA